MRSTLLVASLLMLAGPASTLAVDAPSPDAWREKADANLLQAYDAGVPSLSVAFTGPRIPVRAGMFDARAEWKAYALEQSADFLGPLRQRVEAAGGVVTAEIPYANSLFATVPHGAVPRLASGAEVRRASLDWLGATHLLGDDAGAPGVQAALEQTIAKVQAPDMWALGYRGEGVRLAGIDTGMRHTHEMLRNADGTSRVVAWYDATSEACASPCDGNGHGTHTITTAAGSNLFNTASPQGVAPRADIIGVKVFIGGSGTWEDAQEGLQAAFDLGADVTTNSWGGSCGGGLTTAELVEDLQAMGMMSLFAAGNQGPGSGTVDCPGVVENILSVGSIDINEVVASSSSRGPCTWPIGSGTSFTCPDVMAVGVDVLAGCQGSDTDYCSKSGTSMATPHVAGAVALLQQASKALKGHGLDAARKEAELLLRYTAKDLGPEGPDDDYGWGLAQARDAYTVLSSGAPVALVDVFSVAKAELRSYETNRLFLSVANLGAVEASGTLVHEVEQVDWAPCPPTCDQRTITDRAVTLTPFTEITSEHSFVGADHPPGTYRVTVRLDYTYLDPLDGQPKTGSVVRSGEFELKKVVFAPVHGVPSTLQTGDVVIGGFTLRNVGNEDASSLVLRQTFTADGLVPLPLVPPATGPFGAFADPAPQVVDALVASQSVRYRWNIDAVASLSQWDVAYDFLAGVPGDDHGVGSVLDYEDETGHEFTESFEHAVTVTGLV